MHEHEDIGKRGVWMDRQCMGGVAFGICIIHLCTCGRIQTSNGLLALLLVELSILPVILNVPLCKDETW